MAGWVLLIRRASETDLVDSEADEDITAPAFADSLSRDG